MAHYQPCIASMNPHTSIYYQTYILNCQSEYLPQPCENRGREEGAALGPIPHLNLFNKHAKAIILDKAMLEAITKTLCSLAQTQLPKS